MDEAINAMNLMGGVIIVLIALLAYIGGRARDKVRERKKMTQEQLPKGRD